MCVRWKQPLRILSSVEVLKTSSSKVTAFIVYHGHEHLSVPFMIFGTSFRAVEESYCLPSYSKFINLTLDVLVVTDRQFKRKQ